MSSPIQLPVLIDGFSTLKDGSVKVVLVTRELHGEEITKLLNLRNTEAWALFAPNEFNEEDVKLPHERPDPAVGTKTPSQRLRAVLYRLWEQSRGGTDFESFYRIRMEQIIEQLKGKLE